MILFIKQRIQVHNTRDFQDLVFSTFSTQNAENTWVTED